MSTDYIEWDGTQERLLELSRWWKDRASTSSVFSLNTISIDPEDGLIFGDWQANLYPVEVGSRIYYRGQGIFELTDSDENRKSGTT